LNKYVPVILLNSEKHTSFDLEAMLAEKEICARADVLIAAVGKAKMVKKEWVKEGAVVIDVGINFDENGKMCGDVDFDDVIDKVSAITPVPKGVGVVTKTMVMKNLIQAYKNRG
jgi:methylenetetrahydrofolate dehydrogenase (NADP+)/methenyltetrahydrofolate cyclohydrolase